MRWPWSRKGGPVETVSVRGRGDVRRGAGWVKPVAPPSSEAQPGGLPPKPPQRVEVRRFAEFQDAMSPGEEAELRARFERQWPRRPAVLSDPIRIRPVGMQVHLVAQEPGFAVPPPVAVTVPALPRSGDRIVVPIVGVEDCALRVVEVMWHQSDESGSVLEAVVRVQRADGMAERDWPEVFEALRERRRS